MPFDSDTTSSGIACIIIEVDVRDLVVAVGDRIDRTHTGGNVAVHMQAETDAPRRRPPGPRRIEGAVELHADESVRFGFADHLDRFRPASSRRCATWAVLAPFPSISDRGIDVRAQKLALGAPRGARDG